MRILVVDDDYWTREMLHDRLSLDHDIVLAVNGLDALKILIEDAAFDVAILDRDMPMLNGDRLFHAMKLEKSLAKIYVIMHSGNRDNLPPTIDRFVMKGNGAWDIVDIIEALQRQRGVDRPNPLLESGTGD